MTKRFAKFQTFHVDSDDNCYPVDVSYQGDSFIRVTDETGDVMDFSPEQWGEMTKRIRVEDVPEPKTPGQRLWEALDGSPNVPWSSLGGGMRALYEDRAARLGIKPEGQ